MIKQVSLLQVLIIKVDQQNGEKASQVKEEEVHLDSRVRSTAFVELLISFLFCCVYCVITPHQKKGKLSIAKSKQFLHSFSANHENINNRHFK